MENPFKEPQKGCVLCNVQVDYKNIQVSLGPVALHQVRRVCFQSETQYQETTNVIHLSTCMHNKLKRDKRRVFKDHEWWLGLAYGKYGIVFCVLKFIRLNGSYKCFHRIWRQPNMFPSVWQCRGKSEVDVVESKDRSAVIDWTHTPAQSCQHTSTPTCLDIYEFDRDDIVYSLC